MNPLQFWFAARMNALLMDFIACDRAYTRSRAHNRCFPDRRQRALDVTALQWPKILSTTSDRGGTAPDLEDEAFDDSGNGHDGRESSGHMMGPPLRNSLIMTQNPVAGLCC